MAQATKVRLDATSPFYAYVGAGDVAVEYVKKRYAESKERASKVAERSPKTLSAQARARVTERYEELVADVKELQAKAQSAFETRVSGVQDDAKALRARVEATLKELQDDATSLPQKAEARLKEYQADAQELRGRVEGRVSSLREAVTESYQDGVATYASLAERGKNVVADLRGKQAVPVVKGEVVEERTRTKTAPSKRATAGAKKSTARKTTTRAKAAPVQPAPVQPASEPVAPPEAEAPATPAPESDSSTEG